MTLAPNSSVASTHASMSSSLSSMQDTNSQRECSLSLSMTDFEPNISFKAARYAAA